MQKIKRKINFYAKYFIKQINKIILLHRNRLNIESVVFTKENHYCKLLRLSMRAGSLSTIEKRINIAYSKLHEKYPDVNLPSNLHGFIRKIKPIIWMKPAYHNGKKFTIPIELSTTRQFTRGIRWLVELLTANNSQYSYKMDSEFKNILLNKSSVFIKRQQLYNTIRTHKSNLFLFRK